LKLAAQKTAFFKIQNFKIDIFPLKVSSCLNKYRNAKYWSWISTQCYF